ncbi:isoprenylcysteine carboxylmethyltransferase family protein [Nocardiopsis gilva]|nr:isoprenylcysteine carboxylmethyltransferase family protein [Nocardiopsis gilva]
MTLAAADQLIWGLPPVAGDPAVIRTVALFAPALVVAALIAVHRPSTRDIAAAIVATAWSGITIFGLNLLAFRMGWWSFHAQGAVALGIPVDLWIGWAVLWGVLPVLLARDLPLPLVVGAIVWLDLILMPLTAPVVRLDPGWLTGEAVGVVLCLLPAVLLGHWTRHDRLLGVRVWAQAGLAGAIMVGLPLYLLGAEPAWSVPATAAGVQVLTVVLLPGLAAALEFARAGGGTPLPYDPPKRLVTTGPYAYVRNPMQLSVVVAYIGCAVLTAEPRLLIGALVGFAYGAGIASWHEGDQLQSVFGASWARYRAAVRPWAPRARPWAGCPEATLYVAGGCDMCSGLGGWVAARRPVALLLRPAEAHPGALRRLTYESTDGTRATGIAALARALEHIHLGWALLGWLLVLPGVGWFAQLMADALGAGPKEPRPRTDSGSALGTDTDAALDDAR